jgi:hypothetical protein
MRVKAEHWQAVWERCINFNVEVPDGTEDVIDGFDSSVEWAPR